MTVLLLLIFININAQSNVNQYQRLSIVSTAQTAKALPASHSLGYLTPANSFNPRDKSTVLLISQIRIFRYQERKTLALSLEINKLADTLRLKH